jgi:circadian clock protein KaiB
MIPLSEVGVVAPRERYVLRLYVTGTTGRSTRAIENTRAICNTHLKGRHELEVVDLYERPEAAAEEQVIAAPTLVKLFPAPLRRIIGDLSDRHRVLGSLGLGTQFGAGAA